MPHEATIPAVRSWAQTVPAAWRLPLVQLALVWLALIAGFAADWAAMFDQWWNISTYNHVLLVIPIIGWLIWQRWPQVSTLNPSPWIWGLLPFAAAALLWVLGAFAGFNLFRQAGAAAILPAALLALMGPRVFASVLFPMSYMVFLVPFGDELVPPLQTITAKMTIALVHFSGVPAQVDGVFIDTPAGLFEVAEACSGVKFLIAMIALGVLVCNVCFKTWPRRMAFMALCIAVPILANGVRAWGTIYIAQYIGAERAGGVDHLIYGWVFFAIVIAAVMAIGWRFFDRGPREPLFELSSVTNNRLVDWLSGKAVSANVILAALAIMMLGGIAWARAADNMAANMPRQIDLPQVAGWPRADYAPLAAWEPRALGADHRLLGSYRDSKGSRVDVFYALYAAQDDGREAGGFGQGALIPDSSWSWASNGPAIGGAKSDRLLSGGRLERFALTWYRTGPLLTGSNMRLKLANIEDRLLLRPRPTAVLIISAEAAPGQDPVKAMQSFLAAIKDPGQWMDQIGQGR